MINHAIGVSGVVNQGCKSVVKKYGSSIMDLLLKEVIFLLILMLYISFQFLVLVVIED